MAHLPNRANLDAFNRVDSALAVFTGKGNPAALDEAVLGLPSLRQAAKDVLDAAWNSTDRARKTKDSDAAYDWAREAAAMTAWAAKALHLASRTDTHAERQGVTYEGAIRRSAKGPEPAGLSAAALRRFKALRSWRTKRASIDGLPSFVVAYDSTLRLIANNPPESLLLLSDVTGIGPAKAARYGEEILAVIAKANKEE